ncbi:unnamed protein product [Aspergillus oryzae RIB40]|uniref:DNA, SC011 n=1 Tax=Aspergillus oryzae (strain ATCC 42149 / RIB 40) TaxID=510516 RepID=Q2TZE3_ASPOR|nr:unnamed protein product [Aspergillus oryzae RIB40]BAE65322.1 unnamed protein product [Aspergillus oryzae RIB40]
MSKAYGALIDVLGGPQAFLQFRMMENGTYEKLAKANGDAIRGLSPKISSWNTGTPAILLIYHFLFLMFLQSLHFLFASLCPLRNTHCLSYVNIGQYRRLLCF